MFVKYSPKIPHIKIIPLLPFKKNGEGYTFDNDTITLRPGTNEINDKEWEAVKPHIKDLIGKEIVVIDTPAKTGAKGKDQKAKSLKDVPVKTARLIIEGCQDPKTLKKWFNQELPDELLLVVSKRMRQLKVEPDDVKNDDVNLDELKGSNTPEDGSGKSTKADKTGSTEDDLTGDDTGSGDDDDTDDDDPIPDFDGSRGEGN